MDDIITGYHGKLPCRGDFTTRHLPPAFLQPWDDWLQRALSASRRELGSAWLDAYLASPFWRFVLAPGVCDARLWIGVMMPSVDRVERTFPLTVARPVRHDCSAIELALRNTDWYAAVEETMLAALHPELGLATLDRQLRELPALSATRTAHAAVDSARLDMWLRNAHDAPLACWATTGSPRVPACRLACTGLPPARAYADLLDGTWRDPAWTDLTTAHTSTEEYQT